MDTLIGLLELVAWIVAVLVLACVVTYAVIRVTKAFEARREAQQTAAGSPGAD